MLEGFKCWCNKQEADTGSYSSSSEILCLFEWVAYEGIKPTMQSQRREKPYRRSWNSWKPRNADYRKMQRLWRKKQMTYSFYAHFPGEPGLAGVYWSKGWWRWWWQLDHWSYKSCKAPLKSSPPTNQHPVSYRLDALPVAQPIVSKHWREIITFHGLAHPNLTWGFFQLCLLPLIAPGNLGEGCHASHQLSAASTPLWAQWTKLTQL